MKASDYIAKFLEKQGITHVFELSGGMIAHILDSLHKFGVIRIVSMHHEQAASFAADGYARITNVPSVALATSGPGATNLLTGIGNCHFDSVPAVFITGQVNQHEQKGALPIRQLGFQETDIATMAGPVCKAVYKVDDAQLLPKILAEAFRLSISGRPGPVLIDIPMNLQRAEIVDAEIPVVEKAVDIVQVLEQAIWNRMYEDICNSKRPMILAGRGIMSAGARDLLIEFAERTGIPVITSLLALDVIAGDHPLRIGFIGAYGNRWANLSIGDCDCVLVIGSRLDIRQTGADVKGFKGSKIIYHIDIEEGDVNNRLSDCIAVKQEAKKFLSTALGQWRHKTFPCFKSWLQQIDSLKEQWPDTKEISGISGINPNIFLHELSQASGAAVAYLADVGSHQMWCAQSLQLRSGQYFFTSGGMGAMGYALPAAIGACFGAGVKPVVMIAGDGGFQLNMQELQTIVRNGLPIKMIILNNRSLGMIRQFQDSYFDSRYQSTVWDYSAPDFEQVARAYGIGSSTIVEEGEIHNALLQLWEDPGKPYLLQVMIDPAANAYPKIAFGKPITEMEPFVKPIDMEGT